MDMFNKHPDLVQQNAVQKIEALHEDAIYEALARAHRQRLRKQISKQIATHLRKLADRLEPQVLSKTKLQTQSSSLSQNFKRQLR